jgi:hypothetical protein
MLGWIDRAAVYGSVAAVAFGLLAACNAPPADQAEEVTAAAAVPEGVLGKPAADRPTDTRDVPDPTIMKHGDTYYVYSTGPGIEIRRSPDLVNWELIGTNLAGLHAGMGAAGSAGP